MMEKPPPSTFSLSIARMTSSSVMGSALDPLLLCTSNKQEASGMGMHCSNSELYTNTHDLNMSHHMSIRA